MTQLLRKTVPVVSAHAPGLVMSREHADAAMAAVKASSSYSNVQGLTLVDGFDMLADPSMNLKSSRLFEENVNRLRGELYVGGHDDAQRRFELHQLLMVSGFYARAANMHSTKIDPVRFLSNHYNFDVRRDRNILTAVKDSAFAEAPKEANDAILGELLQTERHLFGQHRLQPVGGKQYMMPGVWMNLVKTEEELMRLLALKPVVAHGNFETVIAADDQRIEKVNPPMGEDYHLHQAKTVLADRWEAVLVRCKPEPEAPIAPPMKAHAPTDNLAQFRLRVLRAPPAVSFADRLREKLLELWVYWFSFWVLFWMVDEEAITVLALIIARYNQLAVLREEAKRTQGKVYAARCKGMN